VTSHVPQPLRSAISSFSAAAAAAAAAAARWPAVIPPSSKPGRRRENPCVVVGRAVNWESGDVGARPLASFVISFISQYCRSDRCLKALLRSSIMIEP
jgi:hypothetical protein